jgi:hypothetical protein
MYPARETSPGAGTGVGVTEFDKIEDRFRVLLERLEAMHTQIHDRLDRIHGPRPQLARDAARTPTQPEPTVLARLHHSLNQLEQGVQVANDALTRLQEL